MIPKYKDIVDLIKKGSNVEAQEKIMELREAVMEFQDENLELRKKIKAIEEREDIRDRLIFEKSVYYVCIENEAGDLTDRDGPYCQKCWDANSKLIRLQEYNSAWACFECQCEFNK
ncbi:hypothetical protein D8Y20_07265 [Mariprofundus sp. EBB-1]|uniref:hypothetical protein n=1 Tax=Mariprofundus sp. EBB-1 TaxID=2650971 RepID=UPI000EF1EEB3|nr:hypothetical protein [Mariprofundus sp. EBB-1]RLL52305.1 hypothetical protein D8Y20_07265 [Mariprofundus sp. EBB-1]